MSPLLSKEGRTHAQDRDWVGPWKHPKPPQSQNHPKPPNIHTYILCADPENFLRGDHLQTRGGPTNFTIAKPIFWKIEGGTEPPISPLDPPMHTFMPGAIDWSIAMSLGNQEAPRSILVSGTSFSEDLVMKIFLRPFILFR